MLQVIAKDGKRQDRALSINGFIKPSGIKCASVTNDRNELYFVCVYTNGTTTCKRKDGKPCKGHQFTGHCYHSDAVVSADLPAYEQIVAFPVSEVMSDADTDLRVADVEIQQAITASWEADLLKFEADMARFTQEDTAMYAALGATKDVSHGFGCCGHIVKKEDAGQLCGACLCK